MAAAAGPPAGVDPEPAATESVVNGEIREWLAAPARPVRYRLMDRLTDMYHGRRDGRRGLPPAPATAGAEVARPEGAAAWEVGAARADGGGAEDGSGLLGTPRLEELRRLANEQMAAEWEAGEYRRAALLEQLRQAEAIAAPLAAHAADLRQRLEDRTEPAPVGWLRERRLAEAGYPESLVRARRLADHERSWVKAELEYLDAARRLSESERVATVLRDAVARQAAVARMRARREYEHACRRVAVYWRQLLRAHPHGPLLNGRINSAGPALPAWARETDIAPEPTGRQ